MTMSVARWDKSTKEKISRSMKDHFANMSKEERQAINAKMSRTRRCMEDVFRFFMNNKEYFKRIYEWKQAKKDD